MNIEHLGKEFNTIHYENISDEECQVIRDSYFNKPNKSLVQNEMYSIHRGGLIHSIINQYYFFELMGNTRLYTQKWTQKEFFESNDLIRFAVGKVKSAPDFFTSKSLIDNIKTVLRLSPSGTAGKVSNYPLKSVLDVLDTYNINDNYYDYSCGWGVRLLGSMAKGINYFGTEPNYELVDKLNDMSSDYKDVTNTKSIVDIRCQGSEKFVKEWENTIGVAFSSPPYFNLEDYVIGEQSIKDRTYELWLEEYWRQTVKNIISYLIDDGIMLLNIKSFGEFDLLEDMKSICLEEGLLYEKSIELKNIKRVILKNHGHTSDEEILVFTKNERVEVDLFDEWV